MALAETHIKGENILMECTLTPDDIHFIKFAFGFIIGYVIGGIAGNIFFALKRKWTAK